VPHVVTMMHFLRFAFLGFFSFSLSLQDDYVVAIFFNIKDLGEGFCSQTKRFILNYCIICWWVFV
jgi:hypothetical protein